MVLIRLFFERSVTLPSAPRVCKTAFLMLSPWFLSGCASRGAPSFALFGAFFPAWMLCALIGIGTAVAARGLFIAAGLASVLPFQLSVCASLGILAAALSWLIWFAP